MTSPVPLDGRLQGAGQRLVIAFLQGIEPPPAGPRDVVQEQDAVDAVVMVLATIQEQLQACQIRPEVGSRMAALLMLVRDFIRPLPAAATADGRDLLTADLAEMVDVVRLIRGSRVSRSGDDHRGEGAADE